MMRAVNCVGLAIIVMGCLSAVPATAAERARQSQNTDVTDELLLRYQLHPAIEKLARGTGNVLGGWLEVPLNIQKRYSEADTATSILSGTVTGAIKGVVRTGVGAYEMLTFLLPYPPDYAPILPTLEYFKRTGRRQEPLWE